MPVTAKSLDRPDDTRNFPNGKGTIVKVDSLEVGRGVLEPGWRWSNDSKPMAGTASCEVPHTRLVLAGQLHVEMNDGSAADLVEGDVYVIPPGHDAWVVGESQLVSVDWSRHISELARPAS